MHKGFVLRRGNDGLTTIIDAKGRQLSQTMKFLEYDTARGFLDHWMALRNKEAK